MARLTVKVPLRWGDMDAFGHVNNATTVQLLEQARITGWFDGQREVANVVVAKNTIEYLVPIPYTREPLEVEMWLARLGGSSITVHYEVFAQIEGERVLATRAETVVVFLGDDQRTPRRLSEEERAAWAQYVEAPLEFRR